MLRRNHGHQDDPSLTLIILFYFIIFKRISERGRGRERETERERETHGCGREASVPGPKPGGGTRRPLVCGTARQPLSHTGRGPTLSFPTRLLLLDPGVRSLRAASALSHVGSLFVFSWVYFVSFFPRKVLSPRCAVCPLTSLPGLQRLAQRLPHRVAAP